MTVRLDGKILSPCEAGVFADIQLTRPLTLGRVIASYDGANEGVFTYLVHGGEPELTGLVTDLNWGGSFDAGALKWVRDRHGWAGLLCIECVAIPVFMNLFRGKRGVTQHQTISMLHRGA